MNRNTHEEFIYLFLCAMAKNGYRIFTLDIKKEIIYRLSDRKYEDIFYFFENLKDLDFDHVLVKLQKEGLISVDFSDNLKRSIKLKSAFLFPISDEIMKEFNESVFNTMSDFIKEINLSAQLKSYVSEDTNCTYELANPNGLYTLDSFTRLITDGNSIDLGGDIYLVENAGFTILETAVEKKVTKFKMRYRFDDMLYLENIIQKLKNMEKDNSMNEYFVPINDGANLHYQGYR